MNESYGILSVPTNSQCHHFISRFILQNFAHPFKPVNDFSNRSGKRNRQKRKDGYHSGESMLYAISLADETADLIEIPVSRNFGLKDMYRDFTDGTNHHSLEEQLSHLESRAGSIINTIRKTFEKGKQEVWITRPDRDILRKFLFIMQYRSLRMHNSRNLAREFQTLTATAMPLYEMRLGKSHLVGPSGRKISFSFRKIELIQKHLNHIYLHLILLATHFTSSNPDRSFLGHHCS
jgi:Protein of unknown function (DUF4238)